jgi:hypothetical protein
MRLENALRQIQSDCANFHVAGLQFDEIKASFVLDGPINRNAFETYMEKVPIPELKPGVVVTDNLSSHKRTAVSAMIAAAGQACFTCA